jgi:hypothetical protein
MGYDEFDDKDGGGGGGDSKSGLSFPDLNPNKKQPLNDSKHQINSNSNGLASSKVCGPLSLARSLARPPASRPPPPLSLGPAAPKWWLM